MLSHQPFPALKYADDMLIQDAGVEMCGNLLILLFGFKQVDEYLPMYMVKRKC